MNLIVPNSGFRKYAIVAGLILVVPSTHVLAQQNSGLPDAPMPPRVLLAQAQTPPPTGGAPRTPLSMPGPSAHVISIEQALDLGRSSRRRAAIQRSRAPI